MTASASLRRPLSKRLMLDHVSLGVRDLNRSRRFYDRALQPLGLRRTVDFEGRGSDYGSRPGQLGVEFTVTLEGAGALVSSGMHICFLAPDREAVRTFHAAAISAGGTDNGGPGPRPEYHPDYYAAFVLDPDGHRIEAVCHAPQAPAVA
jgi:catechol 2,3-dioxygenase-like lactoylglutathione lyase family enzyme